MFSDVFVDSCVSLGTFAVFVALRCCGGLEGGFLETLRKFDHVVAPKFVRVLSMFSWILGFHSEHSSLLVPGVAVVVCRVDSSKLCANSSMLRR